ncbi:MAG: hypothetical protein ABI461_11490, partial [Polyangiaceae bacterium]
MRGFVAFIISLGILFLSQRARAAEPLDSVMELAELEHLADREEWRGLGHYRETLFSGEESEVDGTE